MNKRDEATSSPGQKRKNPPDACLKRRNALVFGSQEMLTLNNKRRKFSDDSMEVEDSTDTIVEQMAQQLTIQALSVESLLQF
jgi:hypothetical protein